MYVQCVCESPALVASAVAIGRTLLSGVQAKRDDTPEWPAYLKKIIMITLIISTLAVQIYLNMKISQNRVVY